MHLADQIIKRSVSKEGAGKTVQTQRTKLRVLAIEILASLLNCCTHCR